MRRGRAAAFHCAGQIISPMLVTCQKKWRENFARNLPDYLFIRRWSHVKKNGGKSRAICRTIYLSA